jgi:anti-anti-sigma factor
VKLGVKETEGIVVLKPVGRLTLEEISELDRQAMELIRAGKDRFVLNMIDVRDLSSSGIAKVLSIKKTLENKGGALVLSELSAVAEYVLDLANLKEAFHVFSSDDAAIKHLKDPGRE